jgi:FixJ family two-component response regulator
MGRSLVAVVDDDESVRESAPDLLRELGFDAQAFDSATAFLASNDIGTVDCLMVDVFMPIMDGPDLRRRLTERGHEIPVIFISARADESTRARLLAQDAVEVLGKPFSESALLAALALALRHEE